LVLTAGVVLASVVFWMARVRMRQGRIFALAIHTASMAVVVATFAQTCAREGKFTLPLLYFAGAAALSLAVASTVHVWRRRQER
jgi:hypothetical protein